MASRRIDIILGGKDEISSISARAAANFSRNMGEMEKAASRVKTAALSSSRRQAQQVQSIEPYGVEGDTYALAPQQRVVQRTGAEQADRDYRAGLTRALRVQADRHIAEQRRLRDVLGVGGDAGGGIAGAEFLRPLAGAGDDAVARTSRRVSEGGEGLYRAFKRQTESIENFGKFLKGVGAFAVFREFGAALQRIPDVADRYRQMLNDGYTKGQALADGFASTIPSLGELAKGFRSLRQFVDEEVVTAKGERARNRDDQQDRQRGTTSLRDQRDARRNALMDAADQGSRQSAIDRGIAMAPAGERAGRQAIADFEKEKRRIADLRGNAAAFGSTEDQDKFKKNLDDQLANAEAVFNAKMKEIRDADARDGVRVAQESGDRIKQIDEEVQQSRLQIAGRGLDTRLTQIKADADREKEEAKRRFTENTTGANAGTTRAYQAPQQLADETAKADERAQQRIAETRERARREQLDSERSFGRDLASTQAETIATRLRAAGAADDAEKVMRAEQHRQRLADIDEAARAAAEAHGERAGEIEARRKALAGAENESYAAANDAAGADRLRQNLPSFTTNLTSGFGLSGAVSAGALDAAREAASHQQKALAEIAKLSQGTKKTLEDILATLKSGGVQLVVLKPS